MKRNKKQPSTGYYRTLMLIKEEILKDGGDLENNKWECYYQYAAKHGYKIHTPTKWKNWVRKIARARNPLLNDYSK